MTRITAIKSTLFLSWIHQAHDLHLRIGDFLSTHICLSYDAEKNDAEKDEEIISNFLLTQFRFSSSSVKGEFSIYIFVKVYLLVKLWYAIINYEIFLKA